MAKFKAEEDENWRKEEAEREAKLEERMRKREANWEAREPAGKKRKTQKQIDEANKKRKEFLKEKRKRSGVSERRASERRRESRLTKIIAANVMHTYFRNTQWHIIHLSCNGRRHKDNWRSQKISSRGARRQGQVVEEGRRDSGAACKLRRGRGRKKKKEGEDS